MSTNAWLLDAWGVWWRITPRETAKVYETGGRWFATVSRNSGGGVAQTTRWDPYPSADDAKAWADAHVLRTEAA